MLQFQSQTLSTILWEILEMNFPYWLEITMDLFHTVGHELNWTEHIRENVLKMANEANNQNGFKKQIAGWRFQIKMVKAWTLLSVKCEMYFVCWVLILIMVQCGQAHSSCWLGVGLFGVQFSFGIGIICDCSVLCCVMCIRVCGSPQYFPTNGNFIFIFIFIYVFSIPMFVLMHVVLYFIISLIFPTLVDNRYKNINFINISEAGK